jgi:hypothetical protein
MDITQLTQPLAPSQIDWKIQASKNGKTLVVPYIDNRAVMERFDAAFGWDGWETSFEHIGEGFLCTITVTTDTGRRVSKTDGANKSDIEPTKGGISDSMKRCAVQFGLGRDLYNYPKIYLEGEHKFIPSWGKSLLDRIALAFAGGKLDREVYILKEADAKR